MEEDDLDRRIKMFVSVKELSQLIPYSAYQIRQLARDRVIPGFKIGKTWLFSPDDVKEAIEKNGRV